MSGKNREGGKIEGDLDQWVSIEMCYLNTGPNWIWSKMTLKGICCMRVVKLKLGMRSHLRVTVGTLPGSCQEALGVPLGKMNDQPSTGTIDFLASSLPDFLGRVSVSASPARSPVFSHLSSSLQGLWTIRAYKAEQRFQELFDSHQDLHSGV